MLLGFRKAGLSMREIRESVARLRRELGDEYVLASRRLATDGVTILANVIGTPTVPEWERARDGQGAIREVVSEYLTYVTWADDEYPQQLQLKTYGTVNVVIDPRFAFGQPVLARSKIRVEDVLDAFGAGETLKAIADEYGLESEEVEAVIRAGYSPRAA